MYGYFQETDSEGSVAYVFITKHNIIYTIAFDFTLYQRYLDNSPVLLGNSYGLGIYPDPAPTVKDSAVSTTITRIIKDFFTNIDRTAFILYHCDYKDGKQHIRHRSFSGWHDAANLDGAYFKYNLELSICDETDEEVKHYIGFMCRSDNQDKDEAEKEFKSFSVEFVLLDGKIPD